MLATIRDRITASTLVLLGGAEAINSDYAVAAAMLALAIADCIARSIATKRGAQAVARAVDLPAGTRPSSDPELLEALRRAGVPVHRVAAECEGCVHLPIADTRDRR